MGPEIASCGSVKADLCLDCFRGLGDNNSRAWKGQGKTHLAEPLAGRSQGSGENGASLSAEMQIVPTTW